MKRVGLSLWLVVTLLALAAAPAPAAVFKIGTLSPSGSSWMKTMEAAADRVAEETDGRVEFKFYPGGVMGDDETVLRKIRLNQLQGGAFLAGNLAPNAPEVRVYHLPLLFDNYQEVDRVREVLDPIIVERVESSGWVVFGFAEAGFAYLMSKEPIKTISDLRKHKVWVPAGGVASMEAVKTFNVDPIPLSPADVRTGLQTGLIDTTAASPIAAIALQWHTQVEYLLDEPLIYLYGVLAVSQKAFGKLSAEDQEITRRIMGAAFEQIDRANRQDNIEALEALKNQGISFIEPIDHSDDLWSDAADRTARRMIENGTLPEGVYEKVRSILDEIRAGS
jgi:TRAP-type C4-dicarboxylate transport system substrate-binding protein